MRQAWDDGELEVVSPESRENSDMLEQKGSTCSHTNTTDTEKAKKFKMVQQLGLSNGDFEPDGSDPEDQDGPSGVSTSQYQPIFIEARIRRPKERQMKRTVSEKGLPTANPSQNGITLKRAASERKLRSAPSARKEDPGVGPRRQSADMQLLRILAPPNRTASVPKLSTSSRPTPTLKAKAYITAIKKKDSRENLTVEDLLYASSNPEAINCIGLTKEDEQEKNDKGEKKTSGRAKRAPMMLDRFEKGDPRRKFYKRIKWKKKAPVNYEDYLPRTSFYSSHDKLIVTAGYDPHTMKPLYGSTPMTRDTKTKKDEQKIKEGKSNKSSNSDRRKSLAIIKEDPISDDYGANESFIVNHKLIVEYLKLVKKCPQDYIALKRKACVMSENDWLVAAGEAFSRGHQPPESLVAQAAYELGGKANHPLFTKYKKEENMKASQNAKTRPSTPGKKGLSYIRDIMKTISQGRGLAEPKDRGPLVDGVGEMESKWVRAEVFARALTTAQLVRARDAALREMGEEASSIRRWWDANKNCQYLRIRTPGRQPNGRLR